MQSRRSALACLFSLLLLLVLAAAPRVLAAPSTGTVRGVVRDRKNHLLTSATVRVANGPVEGTAPTDTRGKYVLGGLAQGVYSIVAEAAGFVPSQVDNVTVLAGQTVALNFRLAPVAATTGTLQVRVQDRSKKPLAGVTVDLLQGTSVIVEGTSDAAGLFAGTDLPPGSYQVRVSDPGFTSVTLARLARVKKGAVTTVTATLRKDPTQVGALGGSVVDQNAAAVTTATLRLTAGATVLTATSANGGHFLFDRVPAGTGYTLAVTAPEFSGQSVTGLAVESQQTTNVDVTLVAAAPAAGSIAGTVLDQAKQPVEGATVRITAGPALDLTVQTDAGGRYVFASLPPFNGYALLAEASGFAPAGASGINVLAGQTTGVNLVLRSQTVAPGAIDGTVSEFGRGTLLSGVAVEILSGASSGLATVTDVSGHYSFRGLVPGRGYTLRFREDGFQSRVVAGVQVRSGFTGTVDTTLTPDQTDTGAISGTVRSNAGAPLAGVTVALVAGSSSPQSVTTGRNGQFVFLSLRPDNDYALRASKSGFATVELTGITVQTGQRVVRNVVLRKGATGGTIHGQVLDLLQRPISGATVRVLEGPSLPANVQTSAKGEFDLTGLAAGSYTVEASAVGFRPQQKAGLQVTSGGTTSVFFLLQQQ